MILSVTKKTLKNQDHAQSTHNDPRRFHHMVTSPTIKKR